MVRLAADGGPRVGGRRAHSYGTHLHPTSRHLFVLHMHTHTHTTHTAARRVCVQHTTVHTKHCMNLCPLLPARAVYQLALDAPSDSLVGRHHVQAKLPQRPFAHAITRERRWPALRSTLQGHTDTVWGVAFSPDGSTIVSGCGDKRLRWVWACLDLFELVWGCCLGLFSWVVVWGCLDLAGHVWRKGGRNFHPLECVSGTQCND